MYYIDVCIYDYTRDHAHTCNIHIYIFERISYYILRVLYVYKGTRADMNRNDCSKLITKRTGNDGQKSDDVL